MTTRQDDALLFLGTDNDHSATGFRRAAPTRTGIDTILIDTVSLVDRVTVSLSAAK